MSRRVPTTPRQRHSPRRGAVLAAALACLFVTLLLGVALASSALHRHRQLKLQERELQADWLAQSAMALAAARLRVQPDYGGETWTAAAERLQSNFSGKAVITVAEDADSQSRRVTLEVNYPNDPVERTRVEKSYLFGSSEPSQLQP